MSAQRVATWLEAIRSTPSPASAAMADSSPKRRRPDDSAEQPETTSRARRWASPPSDAPEHRTPSRHSTSSFISSAVSHNSSPTKQLRNACLQSTGFRPASFARDAAQMPPTLSVLANHLVRIQNGAAILPTRLQDDLTALQFPDFMFSDNEETTRFRYPSLDFANRILNRAVECDLDGEGESSWNVDIHGPLFSWVLRHDPKHLKLDYRCCTTAGLIGPYRPRNAPSKMIDFCLIIRPEEEEQALVDRLCRTRPGLSINHTDWGNLSKHPIAISVETKRPGGGADVALLQVATWHSAQWRSLRWNCHHEPDGAASAIHFLPGIIVQGHEWKFVATTKGQDGNGTTTFKSLHIGDTESILGIFKLLLSLQRLKLWAEDEYWPAFKQDVMGL